MIVRARDRVELCEQLLLNVDVLDDRLDDEIGASVRGDGLLDVSCSRDERQRLLLELLRLLHIKPTKIREYDLLS